MSSSPDTVQIPKRVAQQIVNVLETHVGDFSCEHDIGMCFCQERELIATLKQSLEQETFTIRELHAI